MNAVERNEVARPVIRWLRLVLPRGSIVAAIENEQQAKSDDPMARARFGMARKESGILSGFFDATALLPDGLSVWFEWKRPKGGIVSADQQRVHANARLNGHIVIIATSIETCRYGLQQAFIPLREPAGQLAIPAVVRFEKMHDLVDDCVPF